MILIQCDNTTCTKTTPQARLAFGWHILTIQFHGEDQKVHHFCSNACASNWLYCSRSGDNCK